MKCDLSHGRIQLEQLTLSLDAYQKSLNRNSSGEITFKGKLYDVRSATVIGKKVFILAVNDTREEGIVLAIRNFIRQVNFPDAKTPKQLLQLFSIQYISPQAPRLCFFIPSISLDFPQPGVPDLIAGSRNIIIPPPKQA